MSMYIDGEKFSELSAMFEAVRQDYLKNGRATEYRRNCRMCEDTGFVDIGFCKDGYHWVWPCHCRKKGGEEE